MSTPLVDTPPIGTILTVKQGAIEIKSDDLAFIGGFLAAHLGTPADIHYDVHSDVHILRLGVASSSKAGYVVGYLLTKAEKEKEKSQ